VSAPEQEKIVFVFGSARGGTTYLTEFLDEWFDFGMGPEGTFIRPLYRKRSRYGDLTREANRRRLAADVCDSEMMRIMRDVWPEDERIDVTPESVLANVKEHSFAGVIHAAFASVAKLRGKQHLGSKDPSFWSYWSILHGLFGNRARYVCIVRDGRDVALSLSKLSWGEKSVYLAAKRWVSYLEALQDMRAHLPPGSVAVIRYEDFLADAEAAVAFLEEATGVKLPADRRAGAVQAIESNDYINRLYRWRRQMPARDVAIFEGVAQRWLAHYGYDVTGGGIRLGLLERLYNHLKDLQRKVNLTLKRARSH
jgi:hypothetical protein